MTLVEIAKSLFFIALTLAFPQSTGIVVVEWIVDYMFFCYTVTKDAVDGDINEALVEGVDYNISNFFSDKKIKWAHQLISFYLDLNELHEKADDIPKYDKKIYTYCANLENYNICVLMKDGKEYQMNEICNALK